MLQVEEPEVGAVATLDRLLRDHPGAVVGALASDGRMVPPPATLDLVGRPQFVRSTAIDLMVPDDHEGVLDAWLRAQSLPVVRLEVHLLADPSRPFTLWFVDLRDVHGVHISVLDVPDPTIVSDSVEIADARRKLVGRVRRDAISTFLEVDAATSAILGWSAEDLVGRPTMDLLHPDDVERAVAAWMAMRTTATTDRIQVRFRHATGRYVWVEVANEDHLDDPEYGCVISELVDISEQMATLEALHDRERLLQRLAGALPVGICQVDRHRRVVYSNEPSVSLLGAVEGVGDILLRIHPDDRTHVEQALRGALDGGSTAIEVGLLGAGGDRRCEVTVSALPGDDGGVDGAIICTTDVTEASRMRTELEHRASHDVLSGCLNRGATLQALNDSLRTFDQVAVAYLDLDGFKTVNDTLGHAAGDEVLRVVASRLRAAIRGEDHLGRIGGDEFVVICPSGHEPIDGESLTRRLATALEGEVTIAERRVALRTSMGAAVSARGDLDAEALLGAADAAMYEEKRRRHDATSATG